MTEFLHSYLGNTLAFWWCIVAVLSSFLISTYAVRKIIYITRSRKIYDIPDDIRKFHGAQIPSLGGVGIFIGFFLTATFFTGNTQWNYFVSAATLLFFTGIYDDIMNMRPAKKLAAQLIASFVVVFFAHVRLTPFYSLFGIGALPEPADITVSTFGFAFFVNVFNFVDGIDGLACALGMFYATVFGVLFALLGNTEMALVTFCLVGAIAGLTRYNFAPAKIYMGDTGSMLIGFTIFYFSCNLSSVANHLTGSAAVHLFHSDYGIPSFILAVLFLPVFDALRVFVVRIAKGISPLKADRNHLHYYLLDAGCTHSQSVLVLLSFNTFIIFIGYLLQDFHPLMSLSGLLVVNLCFVTIVSRIRKKKIVKPVFS